MAIPTPTFEYVPILPPAAAAAGIVVLSISGLSTKHGSPATDRGRVYAGVDAGGTLTLYRDRPLAIPIAAGTMTTLSAPFSLSAVGGSGVSARAIVTSLSAETTGFVLVPTFAVDEDVAYDPDYAASFPGYSTTAGLAVPLASAMRRLLTVELPAVAPMLFSPGPGVASYVPTIGPRLPDLTQIANIDALREAQGVLARHLSASQKEHQMEWRELARTSWDRFVALMKSMKDAAAPKNQVADATSTTSFTSWSRS